VKKILLALVVIITATALFVFSIGVGSYPQLDSCFKTSVSKKILCPRDSNYVKLGGVSKYFLEAVVMSEDDKFYAHDGFDWKELGKSMEANLRKFAFVRGGSTITQQLVKNVYLTRAKTISRKIVEAKLANRIEEKHSKKLILEKYINAIEFGKDVWGVKQASNFYFKKSPGELNPIESLYLTILLPSPVKYSRTFFDKKLSSYQQKRMLLLLKRMKRRKIFSSNQFDYLESELDQFLVIPGAGDLLPPFKTSKEVEGEVDRVDSEDVDLEDAEMSIIEIKQDKDILDEDDEEAGVSTETESEKKEEESYSEEDAIVEDVAPDLDADETD
jgi:monofunctional biosynthetic peptidoglycan transglycosylase